MLKFNSLIFLMAWSFLTPDFCFSKTGGDQDWEAAFQKWGKKDLFKIEFTQVKWIKRLDVELVSKGYLQVKKPEIIWKIQTPAEMTVEINPGLIKISQAGEPEMIFRGIKLKSATSLADLIPLLSFDPTVIKEKFEVTKMFRNNFKLVPEEKDSKMKEIVVGTYSDGDLRTLELIETSGDKMTIKFNKAKRLMAK